MSKLVALSLLGIVGAAAVTVAVWASVADAPWEDSPDTAETVGAATPTPPSPAFTEQEVLEFAGRAIAEQERFRPDTRWVRCTDADYRSANRMWVVTCEFRSSKDEWHPDATATFTFDDETGQLVS